MESFQKAVWRTVNADSAAKASAFTAETTLIQSGYESTGISAPSERWASMASMADAPLRMKNGSFSIRARNIRPFSLSNGKRSIMMRTRGRVTAMGLLMRARTKAAIERRYQRAFPSDEQYLI